MRQRLFGRHWILVIPFTATVLMILSVLRHISESHFSDYLFRSLKGPIKYDDPELIRYIQKNILEPPSNEPYNMQNQVYLKKKLESQIFYENFSRVIFASKRNGFFVEAGAYDGEDMSNTLALETKRGWTGLLVEPNPINYKLLKDKHRKAWTAKACLSVNEYPKQEQFSFEDFILSDSYRFFRQRSMNTMVSRNSVNVIVGKIKNGSLYEKGDQWEDKKFYTLSQCVPLGSLLLALNVTRIDLLSLDVEFVEEEVIRHFDFDRFDIEVIFMEWWKLRKIVWLKEFMESKGFVFVVNQPGDIIFVKKNSQSLRVVQEKNLKSRVIWV